MGGVGSGGKRAGAGRKPKSRQEHRLAGTRVRVPLALVPAPAFKPAGPSAPVVIARLTEPEMAYWNLWAPLSLANGTLTPDKVPGFEVMCQVAAERDAEKGQSKWLALTKDLTQHLARFGLTPDGRVPARPSVNDEEEALAQLLAVK